MTKYDSKSIQVLKGLDPVRKRPGMYVGSSGSSGLHQIVYEVVDNSVDEFLAGHCTTIDCSILKGGIINVTDNGRGIPVDIHEKEGKSALEVVMTTLHAGGKFDKDSYKISGGLHGIGISATNALSEWLKVEIYKDKKIYFQEYHKGVPQALVKEIGSCKKKGTSITFKPDGTIFSTTRFDFDILHQKFEELSYLNKKLIINFLDERDGRSERFYSENGITDFIRKINNGRELLHDDIVEISGEEKTFSFEIAMQYNKGYSEHIKSFVNNINTIEGGTHINGVKMAVQKAISDTIDSLKLFKGTDLKILPRDILEGLVLIVKTHVVEPEFESQTKVKLNNDEIRVPIEQITYEALMAYFKKNKNVAELICEKISNAVKARDAARKSRDLIRKKGSNGSVALPGKLSDCISKNPEECELFIVEGDSAGGSAKQGRNRQNQAVLALKGKILNVEKTTLNRMLDNEEIKSLIITLGIGIKKDEIDLKNLRYHKVIIMTDADVDGSHICSLLLTLFYKYMIPIIEHGHLYVVQSPLYKVKWKDQDTYLFSEADLEEFILEKKNYIIQRFKGLGEMNPQQLFDTTMSEDNRRLLKISIEDVKETDEMFSILMGTQVEQRKQYIITHALDVE